MKLLTLENFAFLAVFMAVDACFAGTGVGTVINVVAGGLMMVVVGGQAISGIRHLSSYYRTAQNAATPKEFQSAGIEFAKGVTALGVSALIAMLARRQGTKSSGNVVTSTTESPALASWQALGESIPFDDIPPNQGVTFAGLSPAELAETIANSKNPEAKTINDILRNYGFTQENMEKDFGKDFSAKTYRLWELVSRRYTRALRGRVTAYVKGKPTSYGTRTANLRYDKGDFGKGDFGDGILHGNRGGAGTEVEESGGTGPQIIVTEIEELLQANPNITSVVMKDYSTGEILGLYTPKMKSKQWH